MTSGAENLRVGSVRFPKRKNKVSDFPNVRLFLADAKIVRKMVSVCQKIEHPPNFVLLRILHPQIGTQFQFATILDDAYRIMNFYRIDGKIRTDEGANNYNEYTGIESDSEAGIYHYSNSYFHEFVQLFSHLFQSIHSDVDLMLL